MRLFAFVTVGHFHARSARRVIGSARFLRVMDRRFAFFLKPHWGIRGPRSGDLRHHAAGV